MAKPMSLSQLKKKAVSNTTISRKSGRDEPRTIKQGIPNDHSNKHPPHEGMKFGMSKGITKNMENYESLRVDVWLSSEVLEGESVKEAYARIESIIDEVLEEAVISTAEG